MKTDVLGKRKAKYMRGGVMDAFVCSATTLKKVLRSNFETGVWMPAREYMHCSLSNDIVDLLSLTEDLELLTVKSIEWKKGKACWIMNYKMADSEDGSTVLELSSYIRKHGGGQ